MGTTLAVGDLHFPWAHKDVVPFLSAAKKKYRPTNVVCMGDEIDGHSWSDHGADPDGFSPGHELEAAIAGLSEIYDIFPVCRVATSNHTERHLKRARKSQLPGAFLKSYRDALRAPTGWEWADCHTIDGVDYIHGTGYSGQLGALKCALRRMNSVCIGHLHGNAGVAWAANSRHLVFGFCVGCLIDADAYAFAYAKNNDQKPILGVGLITDGVPRFIPMPLKRGGRWTGVVP